MQSGLARTKDWVLDPKASWHGYPNLAPDYVMLDPIKVTVLTPGMGKDTSLAKTGVPAAVVSKYLWERGLVVEKTGLYSFLILFSLGITRGKWSTMVDALYDFHSDYEANVPLAKSLPSVAAAGGRHYEGWGLRDLCQAIHESYRKNDTAHAMNAMYTDLPPPVMKPSVAYDHLVHGRVDDGAPLRRGAGRGRDQPEQRDPPGRGPCARTPVLRGAPQPSPLFRLRLLRPRLRVQPQAERPVHAPRAGRRSGCRRLRCRRILPHRAPSPRTRAS